MDKLGQNTLLKNELNHCLVIPEFEFAVPNSGALAFDSLTLLNLLHRHKVQL
jgi:hypothetical protein